MARFARTGQVLLRTGVPMLDMLRITADAVNNVIISESILRASDKVKGGKALSASLSNEDYFLAMVPQMVNDGVMIVGDAAGFCLNLGFTVRGMDLAIPSAQAAATTVIAAKEREDFSASSLAQYKRELEQSCAMRDMQHFRKIPALMENPRLFSQYPRMVADIMNEMFSIDGKPNQPVRKMIMGHAKKIGLINLLKDGIKGATAL